jgi:putative addiction module killer protein/probable addiction module antidote protein
MKNIDKL